MDNQRNLSDSIKTGTGLEEYAKDAIFAELAGNGILLSGNFEHLVTQDIGIRFGMGAVFGYGVTFPMMLNYYRGLRYKFELGLGLTYLALWNSDSKFGSERSALLSSTIGLKFQPPKGGIMIRLSFTPFYDLTFHKIQLSGGLSLGIAF